MASEAALAVRLEARLNKFERDLGRATSIADRSVRDIENRFSRANPTVKVRIQEVGGSGGLGQGLQRLQGVAQDVSGSAVGGLLRGGLAGVTAALSIEKVTEYADAWTNATNKLRAAGLTATQVSVAQERVTAIAGRSRTDFSAVADLYGKLSLSASSLGATQEQVAIATETVSKAMKLGGASASETASAVLQLGQALSSGTLQGDELRSLLENAPQLARVIAKEFNVSVGQLRELGSQGKLSAAQVFSAIVKAQADVDQAFKASSRTLSDRYTELQNALIGYVGTVMEAVKASAANVQAMEAERAKAEELRRARGLAASQTVAPPASATTTRLNTGAAQAQQDITNLQTTLRSAIADLEQFGAVGVKADEKTAAIKLLTEALNGDADAATKARVELEAMASVNPNLAPLLASFRAILEALGVVRREAINTASALSSVAGGDPGLRKAYDVTQKETGFFRGQGKADEAAVIKNSTDLADSLINQEIAKSKLDKNAAEIETRAGELRKKITAAGGTAPSNLNDVAKGLIANESLRAGGGGGGGGGSADNTDEYDRAVEGIQKRQAALQLELSTMGQSTFEVEKAKAAFDLLTAAKQADREITPALTDAIDKQAEAYARTSEKVKQAGEAQQAQNELARFAGQSLSSFFSDIVSGGENAGKALMNLVKRLADAALQAALLGEGPLASLFGTKGSGGNVGGLIGALFGGISGRAVGGSVSAGRPYIVGENGPELMIPGKGGMVVPNNALSSAMSGGAPTVTVQQVFNNPQQPLTRQELLEWSKATKEAAIAGTFDALRRGRG